MANLPRPAAPCAECQDTRTIQHTSGVYAVYCPHHKAAATMLTLPDGPLWQSFAPVEEETFLESLLKFAYDARALTR